MSQRYKVRLGDGTMLSVDLDGLKSWMGDVRATAQAPGSPQWRLLPELVAEAESAARLQAALVPPQPKRPKTPAPEPAAAPPFPDAAAGSVPAPDPAPPPWEYPPAPAPAEPATFEPSSLLAPSSSSPAIVPFALPPEAPEEAPAAPAPVPIYTPSDYTASVFADTPSAPARANLQVLADDPSPPGGAGWGAAAPASEPHAIRMKPLEDEPPAFKSAWEDDGEAARELDDEELRRGRLDGPLLTVLETAGGALSRGLRRLEPLVRDARFGSSAPDSPPSAPDEREPPPAPAYAGSSSSVLTLADEPGTPAEASASVDDEVTYEVLEDRPSLLARASQWLRGLRDRFRRPASDEPAEEASVDEASEAAEAASSALVSSWDAEPAQPERLWTYPRRSEASPGSTRAEPDLEPASPPEPKHVPPPPVTSLPVVPLAPSHEPREAADVYEGEGPSFSLGPLLSWTKRVLMAGALGAAAYYVVLERETWFPTAAGLGQSVFTEVDRIVLARQRGEAQRQALAQSAPRLPGLASETILLVFARNPRGVEEAPEVFQITREAAERGKAALAPADAEELRALEAELLESLRPIERERIREYDRTRARRVIFPFENPFVMDLVAQGARGLAADRLARLQTLTHQAVVAGIDLPASTPGADSSTSATPRP